ncbi:SIR2 family NAD-dependent protein deacylase [Candidatus Solincola sp.]|nr:Sir2 family NAD-dependent protein deacetylase [Actinomycetota bacterium]MDI7252194.1 Sir2 family NAD-dependent protein deacetylase [Actinomycetota bacterium]
MEEYLSALGGLLDASPYTVAFTGAGVSAESGIPTFRGDEGIWKEYPPALYGNLLGLALAFLFRPRRLAGLASGILDTLLRARPNPCHRVLARLEEEGRLRAVITQNIDGLHQAAGSRQVLELHGNAFRLRCVRCGRRTEVERERAWGVLETLREAGNRRRLLKSMREYTLPCGSCGGRTRPDVVLFGEGLPPAEFNRSLEEAGRCRLMLVLGTSAVVYPAAMIPRVALEGGARLVVVDPSRTALTSQAHLHIPLPAGSFFAHWLRGPDTPGPGGAETQLQFKGP